MTQPSPEHRQRVRELAEGRWHEPVTVLYLDEVKPAYAVPGRREDGTVAGTRRVRHALRSAFRATIGGVVSAVLSMGSGNGVHVFGRDGRVSGQEGSDAVAFVDAARGADGPWLVHSPSHVALVDSGHTFRAVADSPPPKVLWHATGARRPRVVPTQRRISWPDGSEFVYHLGPEEAAHQQRQ